MFIASNFIVPALLGIMFLCCRVFEIVKVARRAFFPVCFLRVVRVADIRVAWLVYVRTHCVSIATLNQNKRSRLLYLGDAQIIKILKRRAS